MSAITASVTANGPRYRGKIAATARLHMASTRSNLAVPLIVLGSILLVNLAIWFIVDANLPTAKDRADFGQGLQYSGASFYLFVYAALLGVQAVSAGFGFALGWGTTRRDFVLGTLASFGIRALAWGVLFTVLSLIETGTHGWGLGGRLFTAIYFPHGAWYTLLVGFTLMFLLVMLIGAAAAAIWVRWRVAGMLVLWLGLGALVLVAIMAITLARGWQAIGDALDGLGSMDSVGAWALLLVPCGLLVGVIAAVLRRAAVRS